MFWYLKVRIHTLLWIRSIVSLRVLLSRWGSLRWITAAVTTLLWTSVLICGLALCHRSV